MQEWRQKANKEMYQSMVQKVSEEIRSKSNEIRELEEMEHMKLQQL